MQTSTAICVTRYALLVLMGFFAACYGDGDAGSYDYSGGAGACEPYD